MLTFFLELTTVNDYLFASYWLCSLLEYKLQWSREFNSFLCHSVPRIHHTAWPTVGSWQIFAGNNEFKSFQKKKNLFGIPEAKEQSVFVLLLFRNIPFQLATYTVSRASHVVLVVKNPPPNARDVRDAVSIPGSGAPLEEGMATYPSILAWRIPWTEEPGGLRSMRSWRVRHDWSDLAHTPHMYQTWGMFI